jgi:DNA-binding response OmpR family regulator
MSDASNVNVRAEIMKLPESERLEYAIQILEEQMALDVSPYYSTIQRTYRLSRLELAIVRALNENVGKILSVNSLYARMYGLPMGDMPDIKIVHIYLHKVRKKTNREWIENVWGSGYRAVKPLATFNS